MIMSTFTAKFEQKCWIWFHISIFSLENFTWAKKGFVDLLADSLLFWSGLFLSYNTHYDERFAIIIQCVPQKRKPIFRVNFSENCNDLSEKAYSFTKFSLSSFFWHQLQDVVAMHEQALTISNGDVKNDLRRMGI